MRSENVSAHHSDWVEFMFVVDAAIMFDSDTVALLYSHFFLDIVLAGYNNQIFSFVISGHT